MNTFATLLLAYPFYLAVKGRLADYVALAKPGSAATASTAATTQNSTAAASSSSAPPAASAAASASSSNGSDVSGDIKSAQSLIQTGSTLMGLFE